MVFRYGKRVFLNLRHGIRQKGIGWIKPIWERWAAAIILLKFKNPMKGMSG
jgi:hypothetical protein